MSELNIVFENGFTVADDGNGEIIVDYDGPTGVWETDKEFVAAASYSAANKTLTVWKTRAVFELSPGPEDE